ncbi:MAG: DNA primase [Flavobacteriaceae bacterium]|nr:DNA primase [Flavobacteriaceae bacterium]MBL6684252.1 DNA primase [Flavobacteriaceae bacterium]
MISKITIDKVFETAVVEEVIGDFIQLKKSGLNYKGLSPFNDEKTPSFMVSPAKQIWKDFSSGKGGNVIAFLMEHEQLSYPEAIKYLAKKYNIEIEETQLSDKQKEKINEKEKFFIITDIAKNYFIERFHKSEFGKNIAKSYMHERNFDNEIIEKFEVGCLTESSDGLKNFLLDKNYNVDDLISLGLVSSKTNNDIYRARIIFPIKTISGRTAGFGARTLKTNIKSAKYINSPESIIYNKSKILYGLYNSKSEIVKKDNCYVVEGYTDVMRFHQKGIKNVVSSSGTALSNDQINLIRRLTKNITMLYDSDKAGVSATVRSIDIILEQNMNVSVVLFPNNEDPDSFASNKDTNEIVNFLDNNSIDFIEFKAKLLNDSLKKSPTEKAKIINEIVLSISKIPDRIKQEIYIKHCSEIMNISENTLFNVLAQIVVTKKQIPSRTRIQEKTVIEHRKVDQIFELEKKIIEILILYGEKKVIFDEIKLIKNEKGDFTYKPVKVESLVFEKIFLDLQSDEVEFANENFKTLYKMLISEYQKSENFDPKTFLNSLDDKLSNLVTTILINEDIYQLHNWETKNIYVKQKSKSISQLVTETILTLRTLLINKKVNELSKQKSETDNLDQDLLDEIVNYYQLKSLLSKKLNRVI